ncbi:50S ribosomal protein L29 [Candidatus Beckwithbacteria bacterium CG10_big_fil_rev_8_21_14_0_10_34_10]|uniref:Large ribosomal subunit protein uL29 n=1 Tax=Candidatus Beckwithbacteria bacterium CG10_big_fil_rev_8_21_14_0_10_34_10 TaxID=1974495 RepID=A0A2H0W7R6_9BACT|nr:MAG: 50S ribosomal protein L29 [Candidatus Beckwithbacteria bacterium CG10_big_fil_rev_8_21_14_0_10_34_10]
MTKIKELRDKNTKELLELLKKTQVNLLKLKMELKLLKLKDVKEPGKKRREIALIKTILSERRLDNLSKVEEKKEGDK